jgi:hypothetical protein
MNSELYYAQIPSPDRTSATNQFVRFCKSIPWGRAESELAYEIQTSILVCTYLWYYLPGGGDQTNTS